MPFRPHPGVTIVVLIALTILLNLGFWQLRRLDEAEARLEVVEGRLYGEPATNADMTAPPDALSWRKAVLTGTFLPGDPYLVAGRFQFGSPGYDLIAPFQVADGPVILVNRGWIPADGWDQAVRTTTVQGPTEVEGLLQAIEDDGGVTPLPASATHPARWPIATRSFVGLAQSVLGPPMASIAAAVPGTVHPVYLTVGPALDKGALRKRHPLPVSGYVAVPNAIPHFAYAVQWFLIAGTLFVIWIVSSVRRGQKAAAAS